MPRATLVISAGPAAGRHELQEGEELVFGRENADVILDDLQVSRRHAVVRAVASGLEVEDLGSSNGTYVNNRKISKPTALDASDSLRVGETTIEIEIEAVREQTTRIVTPADQGGGGGATVVSRRLEPAPAPAPPPAAPPVPVAPPPRVEPPQLQTFAVEHTGRRPRRGIASRQLGPEILSLTAVGATAVALVLYFGLR